MTRWTIASLLWSACVACSPSAEHCYEEADLLSPEERVRGYAVGDIVDRYLGTFQGSIEWRGAEATTYELELRRDPYARYEASDVESCDPRAVMLWTSARVASGDGVLDHELTAMVRDTFPDAPPVQRDSVVFFASMPDSTWNETVRGRLGIDLSRYASWTLYFPLNWPAAGARPVSGSILFSGVLDGRGGLTDDIVAADITF